jgi:hypothetical protein
MKKWFEFQDKFHKKLALEKKNKVDNNEIVDNFVSFSIDEKKIQPILDIAKHVLEKDALEEQLLFPPNSYLEYIKTCYKNVCDLDEDKLKMWIEDPQYSRLMITAGNQCVLNLHEHQILYRKIFLCIKDYFNLEWDKAEIKLYVQLPGQVFPLHYDGFKSNLYTGNHSNENKVKRWLIMLEDQQQGQCFLMGDKYMSWKKGDVIGWKNVELPHGSANFGYWPRFTLRVTGEVLG